ncbi:hypothetical protein HU200_052453 [Digitaria exilis]|uniref:Uncharacterized protein n=1 Tax=Digitaria exilis TaxID=1010633 RepID=A0A835E5Y9_9POAL|nr:hypothetical protein HU200_052453 [Digitaria exilis]
MTTLLLAFVMLSSNSPSCQISIWQWCFRPPCVRLTGKEQQCTDEICPHVCYVKGYH